MRSLAFANLCVGALNMAVALLSVPHPAAWFWFSMALVNLSCFVVARHLAK